MPRTNHPTFPDGDSQHVNNCVVTMRRVPIDAAARIRFGFIRGDEAHVPALAHLLKSRSPGPLKLALFLTWYAGGGREAPGLQDWEQHVHSGSVYRDQVAQILGIDDRSDEQIDSGEPLPRAIRDRVRTAEKTLEKMGLIEVAQDHGRVTYTLRPDPLDRRTSEAGSYERPSGTDDPYVKLPVEFFKKGWLAALSPPAIWAYLALKTMGKFDRSSTHRAFISAAVRQERFHVSESSWTRGTHELISRGIAERERAPVRGQGRIGEASRLRYVYAINSNPFRSHGP